MIEGMVMVMVMVKMVTKGRMVLDDGEQYLTVIKFMEGRIYESRCASILTEPDQKCHTSFLILVWIDWFPVFSFWSLWLWLCDKILLSCFLRIFPILTPSTSNGARILNYTICGFKFRELFLEIKAFKKFKKLSNSFNTLTELIDGWFLFHRLKHSRQMPKLHERFSFWFINMPYTKMLVKIPKRSIILSYLYKTSPVLDFILNLKIWWAGIKKLEV